MKAFMDEHFLLSNETAKGLYHNHAKDMPICDVHCHINPEEIARDRSFDNIAQLWLGGDHYKWRLMRANGVPEDYITGDAPDYDKFLKFAETMPKAVGNPVYHWAHLELRRYFDCTLDINGQNAPAIWEAANDKLRGLTARKIVRQSNVTLIATTDDPADSLEWHRQIQAGPSFETAVVPTFRPDFALCPEREGYSDYLTRLGQTAGIEISSFDTLCQALERRAEVFHELGCRASDHGLAAIPFDHEPEGKTALLLFLSGVYKRLGWVMQLHYGVERNVNAPMARKLGADTGFDCIGPAGGGQNLARFLNLLAVSGSLPKTVVFSINPNDDPMIETVLASFQDGGARMRHGPAWWFNDSKEGIERNLTGLASHSLLGTCIGMLTDSRSFLSYTRHEYFRRILCNLLGKWAENGEIGGDEQTLEQLVKDISYHNAMRYYQFT
ncbi:MAG: glucuronate isomerase [Oscillospiraceae bacterium]|nr:glucuronate isomerase [Oscillospiraceae bacterium]